MLASSVQSVVACIVTVPRVCTLVLFIVIIFNMFHGTEMKGSGWCGDMIKDRCTEGPLVETNGQKCGTL